MKNQTDFLHIAYRYFRGELADPEYAELATLLNNSGNRALFEQLKEEYEKSPGSSPLLDTNWSRLQYRLRQSRPVVPFGERVSVWKRAISVAAILIAGMFSGILISQLTAPERTFNEQLVFETPRGEKSLVKLPDGSQVWLNANSSLVYHTFLSGKRQVEVKGEAFFNIAHDPDVPFVVKTKECDIEVLGTTFNVMAYESFGRQEIALLSGTVRVFAGSDIKTIVPGQVLILKDNEIHIVEADVHQASGWVDNKFAFQNIPMSELIKRLEYWYDVDIIYENQTGKEINFTGTFKNEETIWQVLDAIRVYLPIKYNRTELRTIKITVS